MNCIKRVLQANAPRWALFGVGVFLVHYVASLASYTFCHKTLFHQAIYGTSMSCKALDSIVHKIEHGLHDVLGKVFRDLLSG